MKMEWYCTGGPYGDETSRYEVFFDKEYTIKEVIDKILTRKEWGYIGISAPGEIFGKPVCEYRGDKIITDPLPEEYLNKTVKSCRASGGWTRMDWKFKV